MGIERERLFIYFINWNIAMKSQKYVCASRKCDLCIFERLLIARTDPNVLLNKRDELVLKCQYRIIFTWKCFKDRSHNLFILCMYVIMLVFHSRCKCCRKRSDDWSHEIEFHGYLLLLITSYIHHIALFHIILSTLSEIVYNL